MQYKYFEFIVEIVNFFIDIGYLLGVIDGLQFCKFQFIFCKCNKIKIICVFFVIEGNILMEVQVIVILDNKFVIGLQKDILEVRNVIKVYESFFDFNFYVELDYFRVYQIFMEGFVD